MAFCLQAETSCIDPTTSSPGHSRTTSPNPLAYSNLHNTHRFWHDSCTLVAAKQHVTNTGDSRRAGQLSNGQHGDDRGCGPLSGKKSPCTIPRNVKELVMRRLLIAAAVVAGMSIASSTAMAQGRYSGTYRTMYRPPVTTEVYRGYYRAPAVQYYTSPRSQYVIPRSNYRPTYRIGYPGSRQGYYYYGPRAGFGAPRPGFSIGIGF
jgi:hypothetical protein